MAAAFLNGIRVLDLSQFLPGPFATQVLADLGADVVKIEPPTGDPMRELDPITNERAASPYHALVNAGKRVVILDLKGEGGKDQFTRLIERADVLLESYRPGVMERLGFASNHLVEINPRLIQCSLSGFGQNGPNRLRSGHDINYVAAAGQLALNGAVEHPGFTFPMVADYAGAMQAVIAILGALIGRGTTGKGAHLDVAMTDAVLAWQAQTLTAFNRQTPVSRGDNLLTGGAACYQVYETADHRFVSLGAIEAVFWANFCEAIERPDLTGRQLEPLPQTGLIADVADVFASKSRDQWDSILGGIDCCYYPVLEGNEIARAPQNVARKLISKDALGATAVLFPAWIDGAPPHERASVVFAESESVVADWGG